MHIYSCCLFIINSGYPIPKLTWYTKSSENTNENEDLEINSLFQVRSKSFKEENVDETIETESSIRIPVLTRDYHGKSYRCEAENNNATAPATTNITIDMRRKYSANFLSVCIFVYFNISITDFVISVIHFV